MLSAMTLAAVLTIVPAFAQSESHTMTKASATDKSATPAAADRNPIMTHDGEARVSRVVGSTVYNENNDKVGSIDDLVIDREGNISAILSVGGFLGIDSKYVEVPYANLHFGSTPEDGDNRIVLRGVTKESLKATPGYTYYKS
jgi:sporulation protein YlmC with PRC-barrel domain